MQKILETIIDLQDIDAKLLKLEQSKGDLPAKVKSSATEVEGLREACREKKIALDGHVAELASTEIEVQVIKSRLEKYKVQLYQVKNNKEYDAITTEMETAQKLKDDVEYRCEELKELIAAENEEIQQSEAKMAEQEISLAALRTELEQKLATTREEEKALYEKRLTVLERVPKPILSAYERIRQARGGYAVAMLRNGACSQCSTRIPPQRGLEIRMMNRINLCEVCGRILVWKAEESESMFFE